MRVVKEIRRPGMSSLPVSDGKEMMVRSWKPTSPAGLWDIRAVTRRKSRGMSTAA